MICDRYGAYNGLPLLRLQRQLFDRWHEWLNQHISRAELEAGFMTESTPAMMKPLQVSTSMTPPVRARTVTSWVARAARKAMSSPLRLIRL